MKASLRTLAALAAAMVATQLAFAQGAAPAITTIPERAAETDDVVVRVAGFFPSTDYSISSTAISDRVVIAPETTHGANDFELTLTIRYRYGGVGGQALTPYEVRFPAGRFPRFARIKVTAAFVPENTSIPASAWFTPNVYTQYLYVTDPEPPRLAIDPPAPTTMDSPRVTTRFYHTGYYAAKTTHEVEGNVVRLHQDVLYLGPATSPNPVSEAVVTHELGGLAPGQYILEWRQSADGLAEQVVATLPFTVQQMGPCANCTAANGTLPLERTSLAFDGFPLGSWAGPQVITLTAPTRLTFAPPTPSLSLQRIWTNNADFMLSHDCPLAPAVLETTRSCTITVHYNATLRGDSPGRLYVRFVDYDGHLQTTSMPLSGRATLSRLRSLAPVPIRPDTAIEYYAQATGHYFFTVSPQEQHLVDAGAMGPWERTGVSFAMGGPTDVCRFYGDPVAGPNSHFYTGSASECASLVQQDNATPRGQRAWRYEGIAFKAEIAGVPTATDPRPPGQPYCSDIFWRSPIYRLYNDGFDRGIDSNHRHVPSSGTFPAGRTGEDIVREMMGRGWIYEGNAFCN